MRSLVLVSGHLKWCSHYGKQHGGPPPKLEIGRSSGPAIPLVDTYPQELKAGSQRATCATT